MRTLMNPNRYASVTSTLALMIALGGGSAYAAALITSKDIKDGEVKRVDLAMNAVDSKRVANGTLLSSDFKAGQLPAGPSGPAGPAGPAGLRGPAGQTGPSGPVDLVYVRTGPLSASPGVTQVSLTCSGGLSPMGGGLAANGSDTSVSIHSSYPFDDISDADSIPDNGWGVEVNKTGASFAIFAAYAVCGSASTVDQESAVVSATGVGAG